MSEISVHRTAGGGRCLVIDGTRVAGAKPEFSGDNCVCWWETNETIGVVDDLEAENTRLKAENEKLRELAEVLVNCGRKYHTMSGSCPMFDADAEDDDFCGAVQSARDLGIEVDDD